VAQFLDESVGESHFQSEYKMRYYAGSPDSGGEEPKPAGKYAGISTFKEPLVNNAPASKRANHIVFNHNHFNMAT